MQSTHYALNLFEMEKIDRLLDAIEHPENYEPEEIRQLLSDPETGSLYKLLCTERGGAYADPSLSEDDVEHQWRLFQSGRMKKRFIGWRGRKGIAAAVIIATSFTLMGMGITIGLKMGNQREAPANEMPVENTVETVAEVAAPVDSVQQMTPSSIVFDNKSLHEILTTITPYYGVKLRFDSNNAADTYLFFKWEETMSLDEVTEHLNTFSRINLSMSGDTLISK